MMMVKIETRLLGRDLRRSMARAKNLMREEL